jgi:hyaluronate lyase
MRHFAILFFILFATTNTAPSAWSAAGSNAFETIEKRFFEFLTGGPTIDTSDPDVMAKIKEINDTAKTYWKTMDKRENRTYLWSDMPMDVDASAFDASSELTLVFLRLGVMGKAYRTKGGELYGNKELGDDTLDGILWMIEHRYRIDGQTYGNWWNWQIGAPLRLINCVVLMRDRMTEEQRQKCVDIMRVYVPESAPRPGYGNAMWNMFIRLMVGTIGNDDASVRKVIDGLDSVWFTYSTVRDGFHADGSYIMHVAHPYTGSYGVSALECAAKLAYIVNGTVYDINQASKDMAIRWLNEAFAPVIYNGLMMDMVRGRSMSRESEGDHMIGHVVVRSMYLFTLIVPESDARPIQELVKYWITAATHRCIFYGRDVLNNNNYVFFIDRLKRLMSNTDVQTASKPVFHKQFPAMTRIVHSMPDFTFAISMHNHIVQNFTSINGENPRGWNMAAGMTYLYNSDMGQLSDDYWATIDAYRLPGTTVNQNSETPLHSTNGDSWVGGTSIDGLYGIAGMYLKPRGQSLAARKSWFMFDDEIVALGSDISASDNRVVETIVENRKLKPDNSNTFTVDGNVVSASTPASVLSNPTWAHLSGNDANSDIGYYFPTEADIQLLRGERSGNWRSINLNTFLARDRELKANYLTLYFDHGNNPNGASYSYVILPNKSVEQVKNYSTTPDVTVLENSSEAQGVYEKNLRITGVNFWNDAVKTVGPITSDRKSSVMMRETDTEIFISVSDPTQRSGVVTVQVGRNALECLAKDENINVVQLSSAILFTVDVAGKNGLPSFVSFKKGATVDVVPATGITLDRAEIEMSMLDTDMMLTATVEPSAASQFVAWSSSDPSVVDVLGGRLTPKMAGTPRGESMVSLLIHHRHNKHGIMGTCSDVTRCRSQVLSF